MFLRRSLRASTTDRRLVKQRGAVNLRDARSQERLRGLTENAGRENDGPKMTPVPGREMEC